MLHQPVPLTDKEIRLLKLALTIACEDGSIYGGSDEAGIKQITGAVEEIERKLDVAMGYPS